VIKSGFSGQKNISLHVFFMFSDKTRMGFAIAPSSEETDPRPPSPQPATPKPPARLDGPAPGGFHKWIPKWMVYNGHSYKNG
jgi:hypothetical protein